MKKQVGISSNCVIWAEYGIEFFSGILSSENAKRAFELKTLLNLTFPSLIKCIPDRLLSSRACFRFHLTLQTYRIFVSLSKNIKKIWLNNVKIIVIIKNNGKFAASKLS
jgi:hypothetical protein